jgi:hypothetical protein
MQGFFSDTLKGRLPALTKNGILGGFSKDFGGFSKVFGIFSKVFGIFSKAFAVSPSGSGFPDLGPDPDLFAKRGPERVCF